MVTHTKRRNFDLLMHHYEMLRSIWKKHISYKNWPHSTVIDSIQLEWNIMNRLTIHYFSLTIHTIFILLYLTTLNGILFKFAYNILGRTTFLLKTIKFEEFTFMTQNTFYSLSKLSI